MDHTTAPWVHTQLKLMALLRNSHGDGGRGHRPAPSPRIFAAQDGECGAALDARARTRFGLRKDCQQLASSAESLPTAEASSRYTHATK